MNAMKLPANAEERKIVLNAFARGDAITLRHEGDNRVLVLNNGQALFDGTPEHAIELARSTIERCSLALSSKAPHVVLFGLEVPIKVARQIATMLLAKANLAIEQRPKVAEHLAVDSAILLRAGVPIGLSNHPKILDMAKTEAEHNRDLRRYMPEGIKSQVQFGTPKLEAQDPIVAIAASLERLKLLE